MAEGRRPQVPRGSRRWRRSTSRRWSRPLLGAEGGGAKCCRGPSFEGTGQTPSQPAGCRRQRPAARRGRQGGGNVGKSAAGGLIAPPRGACKLRGARFSALLCLAPHPLPPLAAYKPCAQPRVQWKRPGLWHCSRCCGHRCSTAGRFCGALFFPASPAPSLTRSRVFSPGRGKVAGGLIRRRPTTDNRQPIPREPNIGRGCPKGRALPPHPCKWCLEWAWHVACCWRCRGGAPVHRPPRPRPAGDSGWLAGACAPGSGASAAVPLLIAVSLSCNDCLDLCLPGGVGHLPAASYPATYS